MTDLSRNLSVFKGSVQGYKGVQQDGDRWVVVWTVTIDILFPLNVPFSSKKDIPFSGRYGPKIRRFFNNREHPTNRYISFMLRFV
jgi:hypothetical protein